MWTRTHALTQTLPLMPFIFSRLNAGSFDLQAGFYFAPLVVNRLAHMAGVLTGRIERKVLHMEEEAAQTLVCMALHCRVDSLVCMHLVSDRLARRSCRGQRGAWGLGWHISISAASALIVTPVDDAGCGNIQTI